MTLVDAIGQGGKVVHLNCGDGSLAEQLDYQSYIGYDASITNILAAKQRNYPNTEFALIDIMRFMSDESYDTLVMQTDSELVQQKIMQLWSAQRYIFVSSRGDYAIICR